MPREPNPALALRIERAYMAHTGATDPRGVCAWFARAAGVTPGSVSRWLSGRMRLGGSAAAVLELLEQSTPKR